MGDVRHMQPRTIERDEFAAYLEATEPQQRVVPAAAYLADLKKRLFSKEERDDGLLPWGKTHSHFAFRPGEVTLWAGINGHGKSMMLSQAAISLMSQDHRVCIASFEMKPVVQLDRMMRQMSGGDSPTEEWVECCMQWLDGRLWFYDQQGTVDTQSVYAVCRYAADRLKVRHVVIDSLMKCVRGEDDFNGQKNLVDELTAIARDTGLHIHLVHHVRKGSDENSPPGKFDAKGSGSITDQVDNMLIVWRNKGKEAKERAGKDVEDSEPDAMLLCEKQRNGEWEGRVNLWFHKGAQQYCPDSSRRPLDLMRLA
jgi:twinkle protein